MILSHTTGIAFLFQTRLIHPAPHKEEDTLTRAGSGRTLEGNTGSPPKLLCQTPFTHFCPYLSNRFLFQFLDLLKLPDITVFALPVLIGQTIVVPPDPVIQLQPELAVTPLPSFSITLVAQKEFPEAECIASTLQLSLVLPEGTPCNPIYCNHLLYTAWPDHGVPERRSTLIDFARMAESINQDPGLLCPLAQEAALDHSSTDPNDYPPMIAGCSAGVGRTGTFIAVSSLLRKYGLLSLSAEPMTIVPSKLPESPFGPLPPAIHEDLVALEIDALRDQRNRMVQTIQQVVFIYDVLMEALMKEQLMQA